MKEQGTVTIEEVVQWLRQRAQSLRTGLSFEIQDPTGTIVQILPEDDQSFADQLQQIDACAPRVKQMLNSLGIEWDFKVEVPWIAWSKVGHAWFSGMSTLISQAMVEEGKDGVGWLWDALELGGDDDVDYNGGYVLDPLTIVAAYLHRNEEEK